MSRRRISATFLVYTWAGLFTTTITAQDKRPPISTDRPGVFFSSDTVPWGTGQIETGAGYSYFRPEEGSAISRQQQFSTPVLFRYGLFNNFELRLSTQGVSASYQDSPPSGTGFQEDNEWGFGYPSVGLKWQLTEPPESCSKPLLGILLMLDLPVGSQSFRPPKNVFSTTLLVDFPLRGDFSLVLNAGASFPFDSGTKTRYTEGIGTIAFTGPLGQDLGFFMEIAGGGPQSDDGETWAVVNGGIVFPLTRRFQLDLAVSRGVNRYSSDWGATIGFSFYVF